MIHLIILITQRLWQGKQTITDYKPTLQIAVRSEDCAAELTDVFTDIFNTSLSQDVVPTCLKAIISVLNKSSTLSL